MRARPRPTRFLVALAGAAIAAGCSGSSANSETKPTSNSAAASEFECPASSLQSSSAAVPVRSGRLRVITTVAPITSIVSRVAGDLADVIGVVPEGEDSHTYSPKPSVAAQFSNADVVFANGLHLEDATLAIAKATVPKSARIVELGTQTIRPDEYLYDFSFPRDGGKPNPHLWTNPPMASCYATIAAATLAAADPANADAYHANAEGFTRELDELDRLMRDATASIPAGHRVLLTYHDAYAYFAKHYGWTVIGAIQVSSFEDPTPRDVVSLIKQVKRAGVPAIFGSEVFPSTALEQIGRETGVRYVDELRDDDLPGDPGDVGHSYLGLMKLDFVTMVRSLGGDAANLDAFNATAPVPDSARYAQ